MAVISYTAARGSLAKTMKKVCENHEPVVITRQNQESVVMLSLEDYEAFSETKYLLQSPQNAKRLLKSIDQLNSGKGKAKGLLE